VNVSERTEGIRAAIARGERTCDIARQFGVARTEVYHVRYPERRAAGIAVRDAVAKGLLTRPKRCERCNRQRKIHGHHPDYSKPLEVEWLCVHCHGLTHRRMVAGMVLEPFGFLRGQLCWMYEMPPHPLPVGYVVPKPRDAEHWKGATPPNRKAFNVWAAENEAHRLHNRARFARPAFKEARAK
jgi:hypothetical protein